MINIAKLILQIEKELTSTFLAVDQWFEKPEEILHFIPNNSGWTISENLEHIYLANEYYLEMIEKGKKRALENQMHNSWQRDLLNYIFYKPGMDEIGITGSFRWESPNYLKPSGVFNSEKIRKDLANQKKQCIQILKAIPNGEGLACKTTIIINNLGIVDVYQYLWFLVRHTQRHLHQAGNNENEVLNKHLQKSI